MPGSLPPHCGRNVFSLEIKKFSPSVRMFSWFFNCFDFLQFFYKELWLRRIAVSQYGFGNYIYIMIHVKYACIWPLHCHLSAKNDWEGLPCIELTHQVNIKIVYSCLLSRESKQIGQIGLALVQKKLSWYLIPKSKEMSTRSAQNSAYCWITLSVLNQSTFITTTQDWVTASLCGRSRVHWVCSWDVQVTALQAGASVHPEHHRGLGWSCALSSHL